jgi:2-dehydropantoate 2-reductase
MRILVVGAGATGGYFGARLAAAGRDVTFLVRPARAEQLRAHGLELVSPHGDLRIEPRCVTVTELRPDYDAIILAVKAYALDAALDDLAPAVGPRAMVLPFLNGMRHLDALVARFGEEPILGGVCLVATQLDDRGRIVQLSGMQELVYGERDGRASDRVAALDAALQGAGFAARSSERIMAEMWNKWVVLATIGALTCLLRGNIGEIAAAPGGREIALAQLNECVAVASAEFGQPPDAAFIERVRGMVTEMGSPLATSMYRDLQQARHVEADQIVGDLLVRAHRAGIATPLLAAAFANLRVYDARVTAKSAAACGDAANATDSAQPNPAMRGAAPER